MRIVIFDEVEKNRTTCLIKAREVHEGMLCSTCSAPCACVLFVVQFCRKPPVCCSCSTHDTPHPPHEFQAIQVAIPNQRMKIRSTCCPAKGNHKITPFKILLEAAKNVNASAPQHYSSFKLSKNLSKAKFKDSSRHPLDTFYYCLSSIFDRFDFPHSREMGILNANPKLSTIPSLLGALRHEVHLRPGRLVSVDLAHLYTSTGQIDPVC